MQKTVIKGVSTPDPYFDLAGACRYFTLADACRAAIEAHQAVTVQSSSPSGTPWMLDGQPYTTAADFKDSFIVELSSRLDLLAIERLGM